MSQSHPVSERVKYFLRKPYNRFRSAPDRTRETFVETFFDRGAYQNYIDEFESEGVAATIDNALTEYRKMVPDGGFGQIDLRSAKNYYALLRELEPEIVVETGVCNGVSTLCLLTALNENDSGHLYSIDYPYRADESLAEFRTETFEEYGGAAIPQDKDPGWIIPDDLHDHWTLQTGKSQRVLPQLVTELDEIDVFSHDSEHSTTAMLFELDLAWEWLNSDGVVLADDINWNDAFETFISDRDPVAAGQITDSAGYAQKQ